MFQSGDFQRTDENSVFWHQKSEIRKEKAKIKEFGVLTIVLLHRCTLIQFHLIQFVIR